MRAARILCVAIGLLAVGGKKEGGKKEGKLAKSANKKTHAAKEWVKPPLTNGPPAGVSTGMERYYGMSDGDLWAEANCVVQHSGSIDDIEVLPILLNLTAGQPGVFLEIGANDGVRGTQTKMLEKCYGWDGLLIEAHPAAFKLLNDPVYANRNVKKLHAAACNEPGSITVAGGLERTGVSAAFEMVPKKCMRNAMGHVNKLKKEEVNPIKVPCKELRNAINDAGFPHVHFASIDVENVEDKVLETADLSKFSVVLVEQESCDMDKNARVNRMLTQAGMRQLPNHLIAKNMAMYNEIYVRGNVHDTRPWLKQIDYVNEHYNKFPIPRLQKVLDTLHALRKVNNHFGPA